MKATATWALTRAVLGREIALFKRYWINSLSGILTTYIMFLMLFFGGQAAVGDTAIDDSLAGIIVGFFLWSLSFSAFQTPATAVSDEAQWGTLEQLYMSPFGLNRVMALKAVADLAIGAITSILLLVLMMVTSGTFLAFNVGTVSVLVVLTMCSALGLGLAFGGVAIIYKRISNVFLLVQFLFLGALAAPPDPQFHLLPLAFGNDLLRGAMETGTPLWEIPAADLVFLGTKAAVYLLVGFVVFSACVRKAKRDGVLGHY
ncbi:ABC-2 type transport system permease protein [Halovenus aranensis]|uniref:ABC-2 type transport system permease protein n=1 Tax=Halovenus aranensis TaxID=890420 RepID=A0A1G8T0P0_9EURY|nr:ABC transporter permease [Halovenus aranensis]SDJ34984.1 ABC-2 type transport system permease protein [Halovenus aranensis]